VHKLKSENERLRAGAGEAVRLAAVQRGAKDAKDRAASLEEEVEKLRAKAAAGEDASAKLAQRQVTMGSRIKEK
jgi:predicted  nucleic acid-binding Zn-ribbon protein